MRSGELLEWARDELSRIPRGEGVLLGTIFLVALVMRLWGTSFGLPHVYHPDEGFEVYRALRLGAGEMDLDRIGKGGYYLLLFAEYVAYCGWLFITRAISGLEEFAYWFVRDPSPFWRIGRTTTAFLGALTVLLVWFQGRRMGSPRAGLLGAWFLALSFQHVVDSHYITVDVPMAFFAFAAVVLIVEDATGRTPINPWLFAPIAAFAILNKIPAALLFIPYFVGAYLRGGLSTERGLLSRGTLLPVALTAIIYVIANPGIVVHFRDFFASVFGILGGGAEDAGEYAGVEQGINLWAFYSKALLQSQGPALLSLALIGGWFGVVRRSHATLLHLAFLVPFFFLIAAVSSAHFYYLRYTVPLIPGLCLLAGLALDDLVRRIQGPPLAGNIVAVFTALLLVIEPGIASAHVSRLYTRTDTRTLAASWIETNVEHRTRVLLEGFTEDASQLAIPLRDKRENVNAMIQRLSREDPGKARFWEMKLETLEKPRYDLVTVRHFEPWGSLEQYMQDGVEYVVLRRNRFTAEEGKKMKYGEEVTNSRFVFYEELSASEWTELAVFFEAIDRPGFDMEIWKITAPKDSPPGSMAGRF